MIGRLMGVDLVLILVFLGSEKDVHGDSLP